MSAIERFEKIDEQLGRAVNGIANARILIDGIPDQKAVAAKARRSGRSFSAEVRQAIKKELNVQES